MNLTSLNLIGEMSIIWAGVLLGRGKVESNEAGELASVVRHDNSRDRGLWRQV